MISILYFTDLCKNKFISKHYQLKSLLFCQTKLKVFKLKIIQLLKF